ncbi:phosphotransferase [Nocardiopsis sp. FR26]|uniref:phosphotransferase n=1 Tax=Nocardiopsis sp. FR26 TaxID=2605987 RepID=UPI001358340F|nr:phosphotransferase [Nocardiopsis sp. FR26]
MTPELEKLVASQVEGIRAMEPVNDGHSNATTAIITTGTGRKVFVKAVPDRPGGRLDEALREADMASHSGGLSPALLWRARGDGWFAVGMEKVEGRHADFEPGSKDLPLLIEALNAIAALPTPTGVEGWEETRWDRFTPEEDRHLLRGDVLTHTDLHPGNVLVTPEGRVWLVDWSWPTLASPVVSPSCLAVQLVSAGYPPTEVEGWVSGVEGWKGGEAAVRVFARANAGLHRWLAGVRGETWLEAMAEAAEAWAAHVDT